MVLDSLLWLYIVLVYHNKRAYPLLSFPWPLPHEAKGIIQAHFLFSLLSIMLSLASISLVSASWHLRLTQLYVD